MIIDKPSFTATAYAIAAIYNTVASYILEDMQSMAYENCYQNGHRFNGGDYILECRSDTTVYARVSDLVGGLI